MLSLKRTMLALAVFGIFTVTAGTAKADIVVTAGNQGGGDVDNVNLDPATNELVVTGVVGPDNLVVNFTSDSGDGRLNADPSGQATVSGGEPGNDPLLDLNFSLDNGGTFTLAVFNINAGTDGSVLIHITGVNIEGVFFEDTFEVDAAGQNFFTVEAINGQRITSISLTAIEGAVFQDVRQVRLSGFDEVVVVPEPTTMLLLGSGLIGVATGLRKRRKKS